MIKANTALGAKILKIIIVIGLLSQFSHAGCLITISNYLFIVLPHAGSNAAAEKGENIGCSDNHLYPLLEQKSIYGLQIRKVFTDKMKVNFPPRFGSFFIGTANAQDDAIYEYRSKRIKFESDESIIGQGFTSVRTHMQDAGNDSLSRRLHGSGSYLSETAASYYSVNASNVPDEIEDELVDSEDELNISLEDLQFAALKINNLSASYMAVSLPLLPNQLLNFNSKWSDITNAISRQSEESFQESYRDTAKINRSCDLHLDPGDVDAKFAANFQGRADIRYSSPISCYQDRYAGDFNLSQDLTSDRLIQSSKGSGFVDIDKRLNDEGLQRTYEHGSGNFSLEEQIGPEKNYIAKDIALEYQPTEFTIDSRNSINQSTKWSEGISSRSENNILISERFTDIEQMDKTTEIPELTSAQTSVNYTGQGEFRIAEQNFTKIEAYRGNYSISRKVTIVKLPRFDSPHVTVEKKVYLDPADCSIADYNITVINDGNWKLGPVFVKDTFPTSTSFLQSSAQPLELTTRYANWSIDSLSPGESISIRLTLKIEKKVSKLTNRVRATAYYLDKYNAQLKKTSNYNSTILVDAGICKPQQLPLVLKATQDKERRNVINYRATIENSADYNMSINFTACIPEYAEFLESTQKPKFLGEKNVTWTFKLLAGKKRTITYKVLVKESGLIESLALANATSVDGQTYLTEKVSTTILIAGPQEMYTDRTIDDWLPEYLADPQLSAYGSIPCSCILSQDEILSVYREPIRLVPAYLGSKNELSCC